MKTKLQAARIARGWTVAELMDAMFEAARRLGKDLPERSSLKTQISMFENGRREPGPDYRAIFCEVYQATHAELGFVKETAPSQLDTLPTLPTPPSLPSVVNPEVLNYLRAIIDQHAQAEPLVGPRFLVPAVQSQMPLIEQLCKDAPSAMREEVLRVGARYSEFLGWLYQDTGDSRASMLWTNLALDYAQELGDPVLTAYTLQRRSNIAAEAGQAGYGIGLANAALRDVDRLPNRVQAVVLRSLANAQALLGEADECARTLDRAREAAERGAHDDDAFAPYCTVSYVEMEAANCGLYLHQPEKAVQTFHASLTEWPAEQERDRGLCLARLATGHAISEDVESAYGTARQALSIAQATGSARILAELRRLQTHLGPWRKLVEIAQLNVTLDSMRGT